MKGTEVTAETEGGRSITWIVMCCGALLLLSALLPAYVRAGDPAAENRAALCRDLASMAATAQRHFYTPASKGGGNGFFDNSGGGIGLFGICQLTRRPTTPVGTYSLGTVTATSIQLTGTGTLPGYDGNQILVMCTVFADSVCWQYAN
jgi:hypothetical protein